MSPRARPVTAPHASYADFFRDSTGRPGVRLPYSASSSRPAARPGTRTGTAAWWPTPRVTVEDGVFTDGADATVLEGEERDRIFARAAEPVPDGPRTRRRRNASSPASP
jgi:hypothetical protein